MKLSRRNIAYDFDISPFTLNVEYGEVTVKYVFSSELYLNKFIEKAGANRDTINLSLSNRFGFEIKNDRLADLKLYTQIEKRGFLIFQDHVRFECLKDIILDGQTMTMKH